MFKNPTEDFTFLCDQKLFHHSTILLLTSFTFDFLINNYIFLGGFFGGGVVVICLFISTVIFFLAQATLFNHPADFGKDVDLKENADLNH